MMVASRLLLVLLFAFLSIQSCDDDFDEKNIINDRIEVDFSLSGPNGIIAENYDIAVESRPRVAAGLFNRGFTRESGPSIVAYLSHQWSGQPASGDECFQFTENGNFALVPGQPALGDIFLEFITDDDPTVACQPTDANIQATVLQGTYAFGEELGNVSLLLTGSFDNGFEFVDLHSRDQGRLVISEIDDITAEALGVPGRYFSFEVEDAVLLHPESEQLYAVERLSGRLFVAYAPR